MVETEARYCFSLKKKIFFKNEIGIYLINVSEILGGGKCSGKKSGGAKNLGLANVAGVFLVTLLGCVVARYLLESKKYLNLRLHIQP